MKPIPWIGVCLAYAAFFIFWGIFVFNENRVESIFAWIFASITLAITAKLTINLLRKE